MSEDWTRQEVEATVADYFCMLYLELHGRDYNKTEHRRRLSALLNRRSDGAIERKHQNISAILIELKFPYIAGYKPLRNYQQLLFEVVSSRLENNQNLIEVVRKQIDQPVSFPNVDDILAALVEPPSVPSSDIFKRGFKVRELAAGFNVDYFAQEARNRSLGLAGEQFVVRFEQARLVLAGKENLASKVEHTSAKQGDSAGFDVLSFELTGQERLIEVKTTAYGPYTPFFVTKNELGVSQQNAPGYFLYRTFDFRRHPKLFMKQGPLDRSFKLDPTEYTAALA